MPDPEHATTANPTVYLADKGTIASLAADVRAAWSVLSTSAPSAATDAQRRQLVGDVMTQHGCLPTHDQVLCLVNRSNDGHTAVLDVFDYAGRKFAAGSGRLLVLSSQFGSGDESCGAARAWAPAGFA